MRKYASAIVNTIDIFLTQLKVFVKKITFIDYKKEVYKIFIEQDNLYYSVKDEIIILGEYVKDYCVKYFNKSIWIAFYDEKYKIYMGVRKAIPKKRRYDYFPCWYLCILYTCSAIDYFLYAG